MIFLNLAKLKATNIVRRGRPRSVPVEEIISAIMHFKEEIVLDRGKLILHFYINNINSFII